jgi:hypothetical protein
MQWNKLSKNSFKSDKNYCIDKMSNSDNIKPYFCFFPIKHGQSIRWNFITSTASELEAKEICDNHYMKSLA